MNGSSNLNKTSLCSPRKTYHQVFSCKPWMFRNNFYRSWEGSTLGGLNCKGMYHAHVFCDEFQRKFYAPLKFYSVVQNRFGAAPQTLPLNCPSARGALSGSERALGSNSGRFCCVARKLFSVFCTCSLWCRLRTFAAAHACAQRKCSQNHYIWPRKSSPGSP